MGGKSSTQHERFFRLFAIDNILMSDCSASGVYSHQTLSSLPWNSTEIVRFLKPAKIFFPKKSRCFFPKKNELFKFNKGEKSAVECVSKDIVS